MDGNFELTAPQDGAMVGRIKGIGGGGKGGGAGGCRETSNTMVESVSSEWTDEKHSLYLNSMEESFVNQLYNHEFCSNNLFGWTSRINKDANSPGSHIQNLYSGQFKVLRGGCWGEVKFERPRTQTDIQKESRVLSRNPWIQHFMSTSNDKKLGLTSCHNLGSYPADSAEIHKGRQRRDAAECRDATCMNQFHACCTHLRPLDSVGSTAEVSDQNFVDDFVGAKQSIRVRKGKRSRASVPNAGDQVQVDPFGKNPAVSNGDVNLLSPKGEDAECSGMKVARFD